MPHSLFTPRCFGSIDDVLVDGLNGVCERPGAHPPQLGSGATLAVVLVVVAVSIAVLARGRRMDRRVALALVLLLGAIPGLRAVWVRRPDAPAHLPAAARAVERFESEVALFAREHHDCVEVVWRGCEA
ncbi:MAG: hypothetical protein WCJ30_04205, partial [Deltaproteobacteria bacterium]